MVPVEEAMADSTRDPKRQQDSLEMRTKSSTNAADPSTTVTNASIVISGIDLVNRRKKVLQSSTVPESLAAAT